MFLSRITLFLGFWSLHPGQSVDPPMGPSASCQGEILLVGNSQIQRALQRSILQSEIGDRGRSPWETWLGLIFYGLQPFGHRIDEREKTQYSSPPIIISRQCHFYIDEKIYLFALRIVMISCHFADDLFLKSVPSVSTAWSWAHSLSSLEVGAWFLTWKAHGRVGRLVCYSYW